jgi:hypothetical protein
LGAAFGSAALPGPHFGFEQVAIVDPAVETLSAHDADLDLGHVEPTGMLGRVVELQAPQYPTGFRGGEGLIPTLIKGDSSGFPRPSVSDSMG